MKPFLSVTHIAIALSITAAVTLAVSRALADENPYAVEVISYDEGLGAGDFNNPFVALGEPTRFTGADIHPGVVSAFNSPWIETEIVSISPGGHLTVRFDSPIVDHPDNPFGIDLLIFGNAMFMDVTWPGIGVVDGMFSDDGGIVEVSEDGETWFVVRKAEADGLFPTIGYLDSWAYDDFPGRVLSDFRKPVDPSLTLDDFLGLHYDDVLELYDGSGGGAGVDIGSVGLSQVWYVRVSTPIDAFAAVEVDAFVKVRPVKVGDLDGNGVVNVFDLLILLASWGECLPDEACSADLDDNGAVNVFDLLILLANWG